MADEPDYQAEEDPWTLGDQTENYLGLGSFFRRNQDHILDKLEECDEIAERAKKNKDLIFFVRSFPIVDALIQLGPTYGEHRRALDWVKKEWGSEIESKSVLSMLALLHIVQRGKEIAESTRKASNTRSSTVWKRIISRIQRLTS